MARAIDAGAAPCGGDQAEALQMLDSIERALERDFADGPGRTRERDRSMYLNFRWLAGRMPPGSKIIVWSATSHVARDARATPRYPSGGNFGSYVHGAYGDRAFALGFSAYSGSHRVPAGATRELPTASPESLEAAALASGGSDVVYLGPESLAALGAVPGSLFFHDVAAADWNEVVDGVVVFREERPPEPVR